MRNQQPKPYWLMCLALFVFLPFSVQAAVDHGDAPASYSRPDHVVNSSILLGKLIDSENSPQYSANADGDDVDNLSDEDGIIGVLPALTVGDNSYSVTVKVKNTSNDRAYITAWIDFNKDGIFQYDEALNDNNVYVQAHTSENVTLHWDNSDNGYQFPIAEALIGDTILRVRLSTERILRCDDEHYQGGGDYEPTFLHSPDGEIEDYKLPIRGALTNCFQIISADQSDPNTGNNSECVTITQTAGSNLPAPVLNYHFDEDFWSGSSADVLDNSGNSLHGTAKNGANTSNIGKINKSGSFNGTDQYVNSGDILNNVLGDTSNSFTITAWINPDSLQDEPTRHGIKNTFIAKTSDSNNDNLQIGIYPSGANRGKIKLYLDTDNINENDYFGVQDSIEVGNWYFIAISYNGSTMKVHINENIYSNNTWNGGGNIKDAAGSPFTIGSSHHKKNGQFNHFDGKIDEVKVFNTALTDDQIQEIYTNENSGNNYNGTTRATPIATLPVGTASAEFTSDNIIEWKSIWINSDVTEEPLVTIYSEIPEGTSLEPNSISCQANGSSHTTEECHFEEPTDDFPRGRIVWKGVISLEPNPQLDASNGDIENQAKNEVVIRFSSRAVKNTNNEGNKTLFHPYSAWDYDQNTTTDRLFYANAAGSDGGSNDPVEASLPAQNTNSHGKFVQIPTMNEWSLLILTLLMSLMGLSLYRRQS